ncbi:MAG: M23 family metallopeptidase [Ruminococcus sp.]|nr:M23 family metallopeptidase [Ruminococcus sp.]
MDEYNKYKNSHNHKKRKSAKSTVSFYISLAICITAIGLAVWSTFTSYSEYKDRKNEVASVTATPANNAVTGVTVERTETTATTITETTTSTTIPTTTTAPVPSTTLSAVETMLQVPGSLIYPIEDTKVSKAFSEDAVYSKTMGDYRSHLGLDFACKKDDKVLAMADGVVGDIYTDERMGKVIILDCGSFMIYYSGVDNIKVEINDTITKGDVLSNVGGIPCESKDGIHLHVAVRVNGSYVDPLSVISNNQ